MKRHLTNLPAKSAALIALLASMSATLSAADTRSASPSRPQLVINILIEGLRADYLQLLEPYFSTDGFNRLIQQGAYIENTDYGPAVDAAGAAAMIFTGAPPAVNGIATTLVYNSDRHLDQHVLTDTDIPGNFTTETLSPAALRTSTLADELRIDAAGAAFVHSIAADPALAIIMAGHAGNSAFWISDTDGRWATSTHYKEIPTPVSNRNFMAPLTFRIDTAKWEPLLKLDQYPALPAHKRHYPFLHTFSRTNPDVYRLYKASAPANAEITSVASEYIDAMKLGRRNAMDMLSVAYTLAPYPETSDADSRIETMDAYLRLDRDIARLLRQAEKAAGKDGLIVLLAGTPATPPSDSYDPRWTIPTGQFSSRRAQSLLNMYLMAKYGNGDWITDYRHGSFRLNIPLIESLRLDPATLRTDAANFLCRMSGVASAYTIDDILNSRAGTSPTLLRRNTVASQAADIYIEILPGWELIDDLNTIATTSAAHTKSRTHRLTSSAAPIAIYAPAYISPRRIDTPIDILQVAPTVARVMRIRSPNGAAAPAISQIFAKPQ